MLSFHSDGFGEEHPVLDVGSRGAAATSASDNAFDAQAGVEARLVLAERALLYLRPIGIGVFANDDGVLMM